MKKRHKNVTRAEAKERRALRRLKMKFEAQAFNQEYGFNLSPEQYESAKNDYSKNDPNKQLFAFLLMEARGRGVEKEFLEGYEKVHGFIPHGTITVGGEDMEEMSFDY